MQHDLPETAKGEAAAAERNIEMLDAPVSGGVGGAQAGTLTFITEKAFKEAGPVLSSMGKNLFHAGGAGAGSGGKDLQQHAA